MTTHSGARLAALSLSLAVAAPLFGLEGDPSAACGQLYGVDAAGGSLVRVDAATGETAVVGSLGIGTGPIGVAFDPAGRLWALAPGDRQPREMVLYRVDTDTGRATVRKRFDLSRDPRPLGTGVGLQWGPDGSRLFWASDSYVSVLDVGEARVIPFPSEAPLPFRADALALPGRCRDLVSYDPDRNRLMRIGAADGAVEDVGTTGLAAPVEALAAGADGLVYGVAGGWLHRFDLDTGRATELVALDRALSSLAFRPAVTRTFCLDEGYDPKTRLSRHVVRTKGDVRHVRSCSQPPCGRCGADGYYEMKKNGRMVLAPPRLAAGGRYRLSVQARTTSDGDVRLDARLGAEKVTLTVRGEAWRFSDPVDVTLDAGELPIELRAHGRVQVERVRLEQRCFEPCAGEKVRACLDSSLTAGDLSLYVRSVEGRAGHVRRGSGCCGSRGYYFLAGRDDPGRILAEIPIPRTGRYLFRFQYRVGSPGERDESVRVSLGGRTFDLRDRDLENTMEWEWSPRLEVGLAEGLQPLEFVGLGRDSVHLEAVRLDRACECGGEETPLPAAPADLAATNVSSTAVSLGWTASPSPTVTGYAVYRDQVRIGTSPTTTFDDEGLEPSTSYVYAVTALDDGGRESAPSNEVLVTTATPVDTTPPTPPGSPGGAALSASQIHLRWTASTDPASPPEPTSGLAGYRLVRDGQLVAVLGVVTSFIDRGLGASTTHDYAISAFDAAGNESAAVVLPPLRTLDPAVGGKAVGPAGGEVLTQDARARLVVLPGALDGEVALTIQEVEPPAGFVGPVYEIGPSGTRFSKPVRIELSHAGLAPTGVSLSSLRVARLEAETRPLLNDAGMDPARGITSGTTTHLSPHGLVPSVDLFDYVIPSCSAPSEARGDERRTIPIVDPRFPQPADPGRQRGHVYYLKSADGTGFEEWAADARYIYILSDTTWARRFQGGVDQPSCDGTGCQGEADCDYVCGSTTCARRWRCRDVPEGQWGAFPDTQVCSAFQQPGGTLEWALTRYYCRNDPAAHGEAATCPEGSLGGHWLRRDVADGDAFTTAFRVKAASLHDCDEGCTAIEPPADGSVEGDSSHVVAVTIHATWTAPDGAVFGRVREDTDGDGVEEELPGVIQVTFGGGGGGEKYWYAHGAGLVASQRGDAPLAYYGPSPGASIPSSPDGIRDCNQSGRPFTADATALCAARAAGQGAPPPPVEAHPLCQGFDPDVPTCTDDRLLLCAGGQPTLATHGCIPQAPGQAHFEAPDPADPAICTPGTPTPPVGEGTPSGPKYAAAHLPEGFGLRLPFAPQKRVKLLKTYGAEHGPNFWTAIPGADTSHCGQDEDCLACRAIYCDPIAQNCPHCSHVVLHKRVAESGKSDDYYALDLALDEPDNGRGAAVVAAADGEVVAAGWATGGGRSFGQAVVLRHTHAPSGRVFYSLYSHLDSVAVTTTDPGGNPVQVEKGDTVGTLGASGCLADDDCSLTYWDSAHVHFALYEATDENPVVVSGGISYGGRSVVPEPIDGYTCLASLQGGEPLVAGDLEPPPACGWRPASYYNWGEYIGHQTLGELAFAMDGDPATSLDALVPSPVGSVYGPRFQVTFRPLPGSLPQQVSQIRIRLHVGGSPVTSASVLLYIANVGGLPPLLQDAPISDGQMLTWTNTLPSFFRFDEFIVQIDAWRYFNNGGLNKPIGFAEVEVLGSCEGTP